MATPSGWRRDGNLPAELTSFVGRTRLLANLKRHLGELAPGDRHGDRRGRQVADGAPAGAPDPGAVSRRRLVRRPGPAAGRRDGQAHDRLRARHRRPVLPQRDGVAGGVGGRCGTCCSSSTPASIWCRAAPSWSTSCWRPRPTSRCWPPAASRCSCRTSTWCRCRRCRCPATIRWRACSPTSRCSCSPRGPGAVVPDFVLDEQNIGRGGRAVPPARRHPAGDRAGRRPPARALGRADPRPAGRPVQPAGGREPYGAAPAPDAARGHRVEPRAVRARRAAAVGAAVGVLRRLRARRRPLRLLRRPAARRATSPTWSPGWWRSRSC